MERVLGHDSAVLDKQGPGTLLNPRGQSLVDAAYRSLGYVEAGGNWVG